VKPSSHSQVAKKLVQQSRHVTMHSSQHFVDCSTKSKLVSSTHGSHAVVKSQAIAIRSQAMMTRVHVAATAQAQAMAVVAVAVNLP
jgi:hypothetical protein